MWKTPYKHSDDLFYSDPGSKTRPIYKPVLKKDGVIDLVEDGIEDVYAYIQSFKDSVDVNVIVSRYMAGDAYALEQRLGSYGDFISVPSSYLDVLNTVVEMRNKYELSDMSVPFDKFVENFMKVEQPVVNDPVKEVVADEPKSE